MLAVIDVLYYASRSTSPSTVLLDIIDVGDVWEDPHVQRRVPLTLKDPNSHESHSSPSSAKLSPLLLPACRRPCNSTQPLLLLVYRGDRDLAWLLEVQAHVDEAVRDGALTTIGRTNP